MPLARVGVFAGSGPGADPRYTGSATELGRVLARRGVGVVYGGGRVGLMGAVADAALAAGGEVIGVLPESLQGREIGHTGLTDLRIVASMHERKAEMADLADAFIALPGGLGTFEELLEAATWTQLGIHRKPVGLLDPAGFWSDLASLLDHAVRERFLRSEHREIILSSSSSDDLLDRLDEWRPTTTDTWLDAGGRDPGLSPRGPFVGTSAVVVRDGAVLLGLRHGAHGAGEWSFPGGKVDPGERAADAAARELAEETGMTATSVAPITWTDDVFPDFALHYVTLHHAVEAVGDPVVREPDKISEWSWHRWDSLPNPLFGPVIALRSTGWRP